MLIRVDKDNYLTDYCTCGTNDRCNIEVQEPQDFEEKERQGLQFSYKLVDGKLVFDNSKAVSIEDEQELNYLRYLREKECFPVINRGQFWFATLTIPQIKELKDWYLEWLDITKSRTIPQKPEWLK